jgi:hypothetical protein
MQYVVFEAERNGSKWQVGGDGDCAVITADNPEAALRNHLSAAFGDEQLGMEGEQWIAVPLDNAWIFKLVQKAAYDIEYEGNIVGAASGKSMMKKPVKK